MSKDYGTWFVTKDGKLAKVKDASKIKETFTGKYEDAANYFGIANENKALLDKTTGEPKKKLIDIVIYHQLNDRTITKTSAELYSILLNATKTKNYWVEPEDRISSIINCLIEASDLKLLHDSEIIMACSNRPTESNKSRIFRFYNWYDTIIIQPGLFNKEKELRELYKDALSIKNQVFESIVSRF